MPYFFLGTGIFSTAEVKAEENNLHVVNVKTGENKEYELEKEAESNLDIHIPPRKSMLSEAVETFNPGIDPLTVFGKDDRILVKNVSLYPYTATARLTVTYQDGSVSYGSGFMVGPKLLATAGHMLINKSNSHMKDVVIEFGLYKEGNYFYRTKKFTQYIYYGGYSGYDPYTDYGFIVLSSRVGTNVTGTFGIDPNIAVGRTVSVSGYPGGNPYMYVANGKMLAVEDDLLTYDADMTPGESGGPVYYLTADRDAYAVGINSGENNICNYGRRLNASLMGWLAENGYFK